MITYICVVTDVLPRDVGEASEEARHGDGGERWEKRKRTYSMHVELLCAYAHFKFGSSNVYPTMPHFFQMNPSNTLTPVL
jgi:hypothetical protein